MTGQPQPKVALNDICSVVYNNTLFTYSADAFQSLELEKGAEWQTLTQGESVSGAACVGSSTGLYVVGGTGGSDGYKGLQKYTYSTATWESIKPVVSVTENRTDHGAVYLEGSDSIVVYAGSQDGDTNDSTQTFSIAASEPYSVLAYENEGAPPTTRPILLAWSDQQAVMVGGSSTNTDVMLFTVGTGWSNSGATLASPLKTGSDSWQASLVTGDDGSKNLYTFDMSVSPNVVNRTVVIDENGAPVTNAVAITKRSDEDAWGEEDSVGRRATSLTQSTWPTYNSTYASTATRSNYASADSSDGTVVLSGGNMDDVLCIFNAKANSWLNATELLESDQKTLALSSSSSTSTATSSSAIATSTSSTATTTSASTSAIATTSTSADASTDSSTVASGTLSATAAADTAIAAANSTSSLSASSASSSAASSSGGSSSSSSGISSKSVLGATLGSVGGVVVFLVLIYFQIRKRKRRQDYIQAGHARRASGSSGEPEKDGMAMATESFPRSPTNGTFMRGHQAKGSAGSFSSMAILMGLGKDSSKEGGPRPGPGPNQYNGQYNNPAYAMSQPMQPPPSYLAPNARDEKGVSFAADTMEPRSTLRVPADQQDGMRRSSGWNRYWSGDSAALNILGYGNGNGNGAQQNNRNTVASEGSHYSSTNGRGVDPLHRVTQDSATVPPLNVNYDEYPQHLGAELNDRYYNRQSDVSGYSSGIPASVQESWDPNTAYSSKPWAGGRATSSMYSNAFPMPPTANRPPMPQGFPSGISQQPQLDRAHTSDMSWLNLGHNQQD